ncbi:MAG TPA: CBS domain-containing protein [Nitrososphaeraceae archaeon]|nr:CBS domain-containing protein [Nitrososphaeraceae archaeon]
MVESAPIKRNTVESIMSKPLITLEASSTALQAAKLMSERIVSSIVITDNDKIVGIITERDLIRLVCAMDLQASKAPIASIMSSPLITIGKASTIGDAAQIMLRNKLRHLGVTDDNGSDRIVGVISSVDLTKLLINRLQSVDHDVPLLLRALYWQEEPSEELE